MRDRVFVKRICVSLTLAILATATGVRRAEADPASGNLKLLMIASEAETEASEKAIRAARAQLSDLPIAFQSVWIPSLSSDLRIQAETSERLAEQYGAAIVVWTDLAVADSLFLYLSEPGGGRILVRSVSFDKNEQEDRFAVTAVIVRTAVEAIIDGGHIGISPRPLESPDVLSVRRAEGEPRAREAETSFVASASSKTKNPSAAGREWTNADDSPRLDLAVAYGLTLYSSAQWTIHDIRPSAALKVNRWGHVYLAYRVQIPFEVENSLVSMTLRPHPFELGFFARFEWGPFFLDLGAGLINDALTWRISPADSSETAPTADQFRWLVGASPFVQVSWSPLRMVKLTLAAAADIYFNESRSFVERANGEKTTVVDPFHARPHFQAGITFFIF